MIGDQTSIQPRTSLILLLIMALFGGGLLAMDALANTTQTTQTTQNKKDVDDKTIADLIKQLGDDSFEKREEAAKKLTAIGEPIRALISQAAKENPDAEVRQRAEEILAAIGFVPLAVPDPLVLAKKPSAADSFKRSDIPAEVLAKMGSGNGDAPKELVAVFGKADGTHLIISLALSADCRYLATCGQKENKAQLFDFKTGKLLKVLSGFGNTMRAVALSPDGKLLATGIIGGSQQLKLWNTDSAELNKVLTGHNNTVYGVDFSPDGKLLASASWDRTVRIWNTATGMAVGAPIMHGTFVNRVAFSRDGKMLASASGTQTANGDVAIYDVAGRRILGRLVGQPGEIRGLAWHPDGRTLATGSRDGSIWLWDLQTMKSTRILRGNAAQVQAVAWHPSGQFLASNDHAGGAVFLWDMRAAEPKPRMIRLFPANPGKVEVWTHDVIFTPEGRHLIAGNPDGTVSVLRLAEIGQLLE